MSAPASGMEQGVWGGLAARLGGRHAAPPGPRIDAAAIGYGRALRVGIAIALLFFGGFGSWAAFAPLKSATIGRGVLVVGSTRKTVSHLEGGIVQRILVKEGSRVNEGDPVVVLDDTQARAQLGVLYAKVRNLVAREARASAEAENRDAIAFPDWLLAERKYPLVAEILQTQERQFGARHDAIVSQTEILQKRIAQANAEISGLRAEIAADSRQQSLIRQELGDVRDLVEKGLERRTRLRMLERQAADIEGTRARNAAAVARAEQVIGESQIRIVDLTTQLKREVTQELRDVRAEIADTWERITAAEDVLNRTVIRAPVTGTVVNLQVFTVGGAVGPRQPLMDVVPEGDELVVDARIDPDQIDVVHPGQLATVRMTAFSIRAVPPLDGHVQTVSADRMVDERSGAPYYVARIKLDPKAAKELGGHDLYPGMQAEAMITGDERTLLSYLFRPLTLALDKSFREK